MMIDASKTKLAGVLIDTGTGKRIPFARRFDPETGEYEHFVPAPNGVDILVDDRFVPFIRRGKAVGRLELVPLDDARLLGSDCKPKKVQGTILPLSRDEKVAGLETYKRVYVQVWSELRGEARKTVDSKWEDFLRNNDFLDEFLIPLTKKTVSVRGLQDGCNECSAEGSTGSILTSQG